MSKEISLWIKKLFVTAVVVVIGYGIYLTMDTLMVLFVSGFLTVLITPLVKKWKKYHIPEWLTVVIIYIILLFLTLIVMANLVPIIVNYLADIVRQVTHWATTAQDTYIRYGIQGFNLPEWLQTMVLYFFKDENINAVLDIIKQNAGSIQTFLTNQVSSITSGGISIVSSIWNTFTNILLISIATFFMILERRTLGRVFLELMPEHEEKHMRYLFAKIQEVCVSWIKASLILSFSIFCLTYIGLLIVELVFNIKTGSIFSLALIGGIMEFVPYLWPILSLVPAVIIALGISWEATLIIIILYIIIQQLENNFLVPYIMSKNLDISPLFVFVVMLIGGTLGGIVGIIVAVPFAGIIKVLYNDHIDKKKHRGIYSLSGIPIENDAPTFDIHPIQKTKEMFQKSRQYIANIRKKIK